MKHLDQCPVCEEKVFTTVLEQPEAIYFARTIVKCGACGLLFVNPQPTEDELCRLYNEEIYITEDIQTWDRKKGEYASVIQAGGQERADRVNNTEAPRGGLSPVETRANRRIKTIGKLSRPGASLLDIGCRGGVFLAAANRHNFKAAGVEISSECASLARAATGLDVFSGDLEQFAAKTLESGALFDVVTMWDVIEHLADPASTLKLVKSILNENGLLCLSTVNLNNYRYLVYKNNWRGFSEGQEHTLFFSSDTLGLLLRRCGFKATRIQTRSIPPLFLKWLNLFKLGHDLEAYAIKAR